MATEIFYKRALSVRRVEMAKQLDRDHDKRAADFDYRRKIADDIEVILKENEVFNPNPSDPSGSYEQNALLRRLAEDIVSYIVN